MGLDCKFIRSLLALALLAAATASFAAGEEKKGAEEKKGPEAAGAIKPKADGDKPVVEIKRTGPPPCNVKPVMTDAEIEVCKRQRELFPTKK